MTNNYKEWEGSGEGFTGDVYTIDENGISVDKVDFSEWGSLQEYIPTDPEGLLATRTVKSDNKGEYLEIVLSEGWNPRLIKLVKSLKFRFKKNPDYTGHPSLGQFKIKVMDSGDGKLDWDKIDWVLLEDYPVDQYRTVKPNGEVTYTQKFYFHKKGDPDYKICAYWCWR